MFEGEDIGIFPDPGLLKTKNKTITKIIKIIIPIIQCQIFFIFPFLFFNSAILSANSIGAHIIAKTGITLDIPTS